MVQTAHGWQIEAEASEDWLIVRVGRSGPSAASEPEFAQSIWGLAGRHERKRLVLELDGTVSLNSLLVGQLMILHKRAHLSGGTLRLCGLSPENLSILRLMGLTDRFPGYGSRGEAISGSLPNKPR